MADAQIIVPTDPWLRLIEYLLVLRSPVDSVEKEWRLKKLEEYANV